MSLSSWVVGSLVFACAAGCASTSHSGTPNPIGEAGAGESSISGAGSTANGGNESTTGGTDSGGSESTNGGTTSGGNSNTKGGTDSGGGNAGGNTQANGGSNAAGGSPEMAAGGAGGAPSEVGMGGEGGADVPDPCIGVVCKTPPDAICDGTTALKTYDATGSCVDGACSYEAHSTACDCANGACDFDPCLALDCSTPPAANCKDPSHLVTYTAAGTCADGSCSYPGTETVCDFGCSSGACKPNPCASVTCNQPPATTCKDAGTKVDYSVNGTCSEGSCNYAATETACTFGCDGGACLPDPCFAVTCNAPPSPTCESPTQLRTFDKVGSCSAGSCEYTSHLIACSCEAGACVVDPCKSVICETPPAPICKDPATLTTYAKTGTCKAGSCSYTPQDKACTFGCEQGACKADPCAAITCNQPPAPICKDADTKTTYAANGTCTDGNCGYVATDADCTFGCENGACKADPCAAVTCNQPPTATCKDDDTKTTYPAEGTCSDGSCSYAATDTTCGQNQLCGGAGICSVCSSDESCGQNCTACQGATPKCKLSGLASKCVACISDADCGGANPKCNTATNVCGPQPSCMGLAKTCGPSGDQDCCAAGLVMGGSYNRSNDPKYPATVSDFRLDNYEITVGRFRKFVAVYQQDIIAAGAGRNPNNPSDTGWDGDLNFDMPKDKAALTSSLKCSGGVDIWQDSVGTAESESLPLPCMSWLVAQAFCIWDGGRLPTEAEWGYAAAGGSQQRLYPWGNAYPDCSYANGGAAPCGDNVNRVGSESPLGDGLYGQSDLAGNVREWVQDWYESPYTSTTCNNCAELSWSYQRVILGGSFVDDLSLEGGFPSRSSSGPYFGSYILGARCARMP